MTKTDKTEEFKPKPFKIPDNFFEKLYEFTGSEESLRGFICVYNSSENFPVVYSRFPNRVSEFALVKAAELFLEERDSSFRGEMGDLSEDTNESSN